MAGTSVFYENSDKIFYGSMMQSLDKQKILGDTVKVEPLIWLNALNRGLAFAEAQREHGVTDFIDIAKCIESARKDLINHCSEICIYYKQYINPEVCT